MKVVRLPLLPLLVLMAFSLAFSAAEDETKKEGEKQASKGDDQGKGKEGPGAEAEKPPASNASKPDAARAGKPSGSASKKLTVAEAKKYSKQLEFLVKGKRGLAIREFLEEIAEIDDAKVAGLIPEAAVALPSAENQKAAVAAIAGLRNDEGVKALIALLKKPKVDYRIGVVTLEGFAQRSDPPTLEAIVEQLSSKIPHIQVAAVRACRQRKAARPLAALVSLLEEHWQKRDRVLFETRQALVALTGQDLEAVEDWKKFVGGLPESFDPGTVGKDAGPTAVVPKKTSESVEFFGSEIFSHNVVFVIDVSGSMVMYDDDPAYNGPDIEKDRQRLGRAKEQLSQVLKKLPKSARFNLITFSDKVLSWQKQMQPATPASVASAQKFVGEFVARGATHTDEALETSFQDFGVDTIVLLSDGAPMKAGQREPGPLIEKIVQRIRDLNACRRVRIDTFGFEGEGRWPAKVPWGAGRLPPPPKPEDLKKFVEFLKTLAADSGGSYRPIQ